MIHTQIALAPLEIVHAKRARPRDGAEEEGEATATTTTANNNGRASELHLTVRLRVRLWVHQAAPRLCPEHRKGELPKCLRLVNLLLLATAEDLPLPTDRLLASRARRRLATLFEEASAASAPVQLQQQQQQQAQPQPSVVDPVASSCLTRLPDVMLGLVFSYVLAPELRALEQTCRHMQEATKHIVPGLKARLHPHQLRSLDWMLARETRGGGEGGGEGPQTIPHPAWEELRGCREVGAAELEGRGREEDGGAPSSFSVWVNVTDGRLALAAEGVPRLQDARSGLLADEMGLGKTVTALALILKTRGLLPSPVPPPAGPEAGGAEDEEGAQRFGGRFQFRSPQSRRRQVDPSKMRPSPATLVVSPGPLLQHWREQIALHCESWALGLGRHVLVDDAVDDKGRLLPLPPAETLAGYEVVVVSKERLRQEWKTGRPTCALEERRPRRYSTSGFVELLPQAGERLSPLLEVHWLRVVVDEGHSLGALSITNEIQMAKSLEAERRWVMTGTPHRHDTADLASLRELLIFLRQEPYGLWHDLSWAKLIGGGRGGPGGGAHGAGLLPPPLAERRLLALLRRVLIRHTKAATDIPRPVVVRTRLRMSRLEANTYNTLVSLVQANLLTTGLEGGSHLPGAAHPDSMLNPANKQESNTLLHNVRLACCGGGQQEVSLDVATVAETLNLARKFGCADDGSDAGAEERWALVAAYLNRLRLNTTTPCDACGVPLLILLITPCLHLLCCRCMRGRNNVCGRCLAPFDVDEFQLLQPGLSIHWREDEVLALPPAAAAASSNGPSSSVVLSPASPVAAAASSASASAAAPLHDEQQQDEQGQEERKDGMGATGSDADGRLGGGKDGDEEEEEADHDEMGADGDDGSWRVVTKAWHMITVLQEYQAALLSAAKGRPRLPLKAVVFSQFRSYLNGLAAALRSQGFRVGCFFDRTRVQDLTAFRSDCPRTGLEVLLIGREGSHGLDLSMATHLFVMDQIFDRNLEDQVVSRAYRMGAKAPCRVEFLSMAGTVEETMEQLVTATATATATAPGSASAGGRDEVEGSTDGGDDAVGGGGNGGKKGGNGRNGGGGGGGGRSQKKRRASLTMGGRKRSSAGSAGKSGTGAAGGGTEDMTKMHVLLQSLDLVEVPEMRRALRRASPAGAVGHRLGGGGGGLGGGVKVAAPAPAAAVATAAAAAVAATEEVEATAAQAPARRVRFADPDDA